MGAEHKGFTEHGPNALPFKHRDKRTPYDRGTDRLRVDALAIVENSDEFRDLSVSDAARLAEKVLAIAHRDEVKRPS
jgi:hypothetical protein